jgi:hypothetical protein
MGQNARMLIQSFAQKVETVRRCRSAPMDRPAKVMKAFGDGYRVTVSFDGESHVLFLKTREVPLLLNEFPGVTELWSLFASA